MKQLSIKNLCTYIPSITCIVTSVVAQENWLTLDSLKINHSVEKTAISADAHSQPPKPSQITSGPKKIRLDRAVNQNTSPTQTKMDSTMYALIEGIQITSETSELSDESIITCYFLFRNRPSSFLYEINIHEKQIIFEFYDTREGHFPVPTMCVLPIKSYKIESETIDKNNGVKGSNPEWHDLIRIIFNLEEIPQISVSNEYGILSFTFKWSSNPGKNKRYLYKNNSRKAILYSVAGIGGIGVGALGYFIFLKNPDPSENNSLSIDDLPSRP